MDFIIVKNEIKLNDYYYGIILLIVLRARSLSGNIGVGSDVITIHLAM